MPFVGRPACLACLPECFVGNPMYLSGHPTYYVEHPKCCAGRPGRGVAEAESGAALPDYILKGNSSDMKKTILLLLLAVCAATSAGAAVRDSAALLPREVRAVWLTTLSGLDWPSRTATSAAGFAEQRRELCEILDRLQAAGINTVLFQTRIRATTAYPSALEPWDVAFTGRPGREPGYDPLRFAVDECHRRNMELHAWVVAFPVGKVSAARALGSAALPHRRPDLCVRCGEQWMMDPGVPATADYLAELCAEIVRGYAVDGIHLDYIRYPEHGIPWNDARTYSRYGGGRPLAMWRRENVTRCVRKVHDAVKAVRPWVKMSCSPVGKHADLPRQSSYGWNARDAVFQDAQAWLADGLMDMLFPMMYFDGRHFYPFVLDWQEHSAGRPVVPGLGIYFLSPREKDWGIDVVRRQLYFLRDAGLGGAAFFRSRFFTDNVKGLYDFVADDLWHTPALVPPMTWADSIAPPAPAIRLSREGMTLRLTWTPVADKGTGGAVRYNVYRLDGDADAPDGVRLLAQNLTETSFSYTPALPSALYARYVVTALDAYGNESAHDGGATLAVPFRLTDKELRKK